MMTIKEVAEYIKLMEKTAYCLALERKILSFKVGGAWRFRPSKIDNWIDIEANRQKGKSKE